MAYDVIWRYILAEEYEKAIQFYREYNPKALDEPPKDKRVFRSQAHVLYGLAEYANGKNTLFPLIRSGVSDWYEKCQNFAVNDLYLNYYVCLSWSYFWHHYFCSSDDIIIIIRNLRGY